jgi:hypothetical protein
MSGGSEMSGFIALIIIGQSGRIGYTGIHGLPAASLRHDARVKGVHPPFDLWPKHFFLRVLCVSSAAGGAISFRRGEPA